MGYETRIHIQRPYGFVTHVGPNRDIERSGGTTLAAVSLGKIGGRANEALSEQALDANGYLYCRDGTGCPDDEREKYPFIYEDAYGDPLYRVPLPAALEALRPHILGPALAVLEAYAKSPSGDRLVCLVEGY